MKLALILTLGLVASTSGAIVGLTFGSSGFTFVNVNPTSGASYAGQKSIITRPGGTLSMNNVLPGSDDLVFSLQTDSANAGFLVKQDLRIGGRREDCMLGSNMLVHIFGSKEKDTVIATGVSNSQFGIFKVSFNPNNRYCKVASLLASVPSVNSIGMFGQASFGDNIYFTTEANTKFALTSGAEIRSYTIGTDAATKLYTAVNLKGIFVTSMTAKDAKNLIVQGYDMATSTVTYGTWEVDLEASTYTTARNGNTNSEELGFGGVYDAASNQQLALKLKTANSVTTQNIGSTSLASTTTIESTRTTALSNSIFALFDIAQPKFKAVDADTASTANTIRLTGNGLIAGTDTNSLARCRFTVGSVAAVEVTATGSTTQEGVTCTFTPPTATSTTGTVIKVEFSADGVNYSKSISFIHGSTTAASIKFEKSSYMLQDGLTFPSNRAPISAELFDASGNKLLFSATSFSAVLSASSSDASFSNSGGVTATTVQGRFDFPSFFVDVYSTSATDGVANLVLNVVSGSISTTASAKARNNGVTRGTVAGLTLGSSKFSYALVNPTVNTAVALGDRTLTSGNAVAYGLSTYDTTNNVYNTVEINSAGSPLLIGYSISSTSTNTDGTGSCIIPTTTLMTDTPAKIAYEKTNADGSSDFLAVVNLGTTTGANFKIVRITRAKASLATATCSISTIDELPLSEVAYSHIEFINGGRLALIERDNIFSTTFNSYLHVWTLSTSTTAGSWKIRNKQLDFSVVGLTQSGDDELAINGFKIAAGVTTSGVWTVDLSDDASSVIAPVDKKTAYTTTDEQAYFNYAGNADAPVDSRLRSTVSRTSAGVANVDTVQMFRPISSAVASRSTTAVNNYVDFFNLVDAAVLSVNPSTIATTVTSTTTVSVTAKNVIAYSGSLKCRFSSPSATTSTENSIVVSGTTATFPADGATYDCGAFPTTLLGANRAVYVQISVDGGENYGPAQCISVGSNQCPSVLGVVAPSTAPGASATPTTAVPTPISGTDTALQKGFFFAGKTAADCAAQSTVVLGFLSQAGVTGTIPTNGCSFVTNFVGNRVRGLQTSGLSIITVLTNAADVTTLNNWVASTDGQTALNTAGATTFTPTAAATTTDDDDDDLSDGEIAGIVIGSIVGVILIGALIAFALKSGGNKSPAPQPAAATYASRDATSFTAPDSTSGSYDSTSGSYDYDSDGTGSYDSEDYSDYSGSSYV